MCWPDVSEICDMFDFSGCRLLRLGRCAERAGIYFRCGRCGAQPAKRRVVFLGFLFGWIIAPLQLYMHVHTRPNLRQRPTQVPPQSCSSLRVEPAFEPTRFGHVAFDSSVAATSFGRRFPWHCPVIWLRLGRVRANPTSISVCKRLEDGFATQWLTAMVAVTLTKGSQ